MLYIAFRIQRETVPLTPEPQTAVKFFPIRDRHGEPLTFDAESPQAAFSLACARGNLPSIFLAVEPLEKYQNDLARFAADAADPSRIHRPAALKSPRTPHSDASRGKDSH